MGAAMSVPVMATIGGGILYCGASAIGIMCGSVNLVGTFRETFEAVRYVKWCGHRITQQTNPDFYWNVLGLIDLFTHLRTTGALPGVKKQNLNTEILTQKGQEHIVETTEKIVTQNGRETGKATRAIDQTTNKQNTQQGKLVTTGPTKVIKTIEVNDAIAADGSIVRVRTETTLTTTTVSTNYVYNVGKSAEFEFVLVFPNEDGSSTEYTYWIRALPALNHSAYPDLWIHTSKTQPDALARLMSLDAHFPRDARGNLDIQKIINPEAPTTGVAKKEPGEPEPVKARRPAARNIEKDTVPLVYDVWNSEGGFW